MTLRRQEDNENFRKNWWDSSKDDASVITSHFCSVLLFGYDRSIGEQYIQPFLSYPRTTHDL